MHYVTLVALRPLSGDDYGNIAPGATFTTDNRKAEKLEAKGLAYRYRAPRPRITPKMIVRSPENKALRPAENK